MFLKLTENETGSDVYVNPLHILRFVPNSAGEGTLIFMDADAGLGPKEDPQILHVHEHAEEVFRMISRHEKQHPGRSGGGTTNRGFI